MPHKREFINCFTDLYCMEINAANACLLNSSLATSNTLFGQEMVLVMQTPHAQRWYFLYRVDKRLFSSIENVHRYYTNPLFWV